MHKKWWLLVNQTSDGRNCEFAPANPTTGSISFPFDDSVSTCLSCFCFGHLVAGQKLTAQLWHVITLRSYSSYLSTDYIFCKHRARKWCIRTLVSVHLIFERQDGDWNKMRRFRIPEKQYFVVWRCGARGCSFVLCATLAVCPDCLCHRNAAPPVTWQAHYGRSPPLITV